MLLQEERPFLSGSVLVSWIQEIMRLNDHIVHVTFGSSGYDQPLKMLTQSARRFSVRDIRVFRDNHFVVDRLKRDFPHIMSQERGFGYWLWKPHIIAHTLDSVPDGTTVLYSDAAVIYARDPSSLVYLAKQHDIVTTLNKPGNLQNRYTKRDCFVLLDADCPEEWSRRQLDAAFLVVRASDNSKSFIQEWAAALSDPRILTDMPNTCGLPNLDEFKDHRHDQSVLTILAARKGITSIESLTDPGSPQLRMFYHHTFDVFTSPIRFAARLTGIRLGIWPNRWTRKTKRRKRSP